MVSGRGKRQSALDTGRTRPATPLITVAGGCPQKCCSSLAKEVAERCKQCESRDNCRRPSIKPLARAGVEWLERACMIGKSGWRAARVSSLPVGACALNATDCARPNHKEQRACPALPISTQRVTWALFTPIICTLHAIPPTLAVSTSSVHWPRAARRRRRRQACSLRPLPPLQSVVAEHCCDGYASQGRPRALPLPAARPCSS